MPLLLLVFACLLPGSPAAEPRGVDHRRIVAADGEPGNWLSHGRTYAEQRYSPLKAIDTDNVNTLGLAWALDLGTHRGLEATPLALDGVLYFTGTWSVVYAVDGASGGKAEGGYKPLYTPNLAEVHRQGPLCGA